jgi:UDP-2,4-diacetamido-2,4,6-trideoxy-beta-L-altropyranose hydrolase
MTAQKSLFIRADASPEIGTGHVMRCLALAQATQAEGMKVRIVGCINVPWVKDRLMQEDISLTDIPHAIQKRVPPEVLLAQIDSSTDWIVLDGYHFGPDCQKAVREAGYKLMVIDDYNHLPEYHCDVLLNQNIGSENFIYKGDVGRKLLGPKYVLLRPEFTSARSEAAKKIFPEKARSILFTLGGGDFSAHLEHMAPAFAAPALADCTLRVIAGSMPEDNIRFALRYCQASLEILQCVDDMPGLLLKTDLCITAGGSTCWELCCLGVPFLVQPVADNQQEIARCLIRNDIAESFSHDMISSMLNDIGKRKELAEKAKSLTDGRGTLYVLETLSDKY